MELIRTLGASVRPVARGPIRVAMDAINHLLRIRCVDTLVISVVEFLLIHVQPHQRPPWRTGCAKDKPAAVMAGSAAAPVARCRKCLRCVDFMVPRRSRFTPTALPARGISYECSFPRAMPLALAAVSPRSHLHGSYGGVPRNKVVLDGS